MKKAILDWLHELPEGYKQLALAQTTARHCDWSWSAHSMGEALDKAFSWEASEEGGDFWYEVHDHWDDPINLPKLPSREEPYELICAEALRIQGGDRQQDYGSPKQNFEDIAGMINSYLAVAYPDSKIKLTARDVAHIMILTKVARNCHKPKRDNWVDIAGYAQCGALVDGV